MNIHRFSRAAVLGATTAALVAGSFGFAGTAQAAQSRLTISGTPQIGATLGVNQADAGDLVWTLWGDSSCSSQELGYAFGSPFTVPETFTGDYPTYTNSGSAVSTLGKYLSVDQLGSGYASSVCSAAITAAATPTPTPTPTPTASASPSASATATASASPSPTATSSSASAGGSGGGSTGGGGGGGGGATPVGLSDEAVTWSTAPTAPQVGQILSATITANPSTSTLSYVWGRNVGGTCTAYLPLLTGSAMNVTDAMRGDTPCVAITGSATNFGDATRTVTLGSAVTAATALPAPTLSGTAQVGTPLTCVQPAAPSGVATYTWLRGIVPVGAGATYTPAATDLGGLLTCAMTLTRPGWTEQSSTVTSAPVALGAAGRYAVSVAGSPSVGQRLTASIAQLPSDASVAWVWTAGGKTVGTSDSYVVTRTDRKKQIAVTATITRAGYATSSANTVVGKARRLVVKFKIRERRVPRSGRVHFKAANLSPRQAWVIRLERTGTVLARGKVAAGKHLVRGVVKLPARTPVGRHAVEFRTVAPNQRVGVSLRVVAQR